MMPESTTQSRAAEQHPTVRLAELQKQLEVLQQQQQKEREEPVQLRFMLERGERGPIGQYSSRIHPSPLISVYPSKFYNELQ
jgi:hypothetical protein